MLILLELLLLLLALLSLLLLYVLSPICVYLRAGASPHYGGPILEHWVYTRGTWFA